MIVAGPGFNNGEGEDKDLPRPMLSDTSDSQHDHDCKANKTEDQPDASSDSDAKPERRTNSGERIAGSHGKTGSPSNTARFRKHNASSEPIIPLPFAALDDPDWFINYVGYIISHFRYGLNARQFKLLPAMEAFIAERLEELNKTPVSRFFEDSKLPGKRLPSLKLTGIRRIRAIELSRALLRLALHNPYLVQTVVMGYCHTVSTRMCTVLTEYEDAGLGRMLLQLVKKLNFPSLSYRIIGFQVGDRRADMVPWLIALGLHPETDIKWELAHNCDNDAALKHIGIEIVWNQSKRASREFHEVALVAAVISLWQCVSISTP